ncbi:hypothetical protein QWM81_05460 [Streptomyces ficellus]|uniref:Uncharacterized protein n=1 Tax=Streptomyces ficellus TaxID=1977088 RepID=A0ABT7Z1X6_9ACTN|nr:hypothetical protein [Streptomyces ficellus]MDN3293495.1 hypothetical protein [Streptomyces ficellus]
MTLLLTCVTPAYAVQASDRRLTYLDGEIAEEKANKATILGNFAAFSYTGLARCSVGEPTDELLMRCLAAQGKNFSGLLDELAKNASRDVRNLPLRVPKANKRAVRRTSFVGSGFVGLRNPQVFNREKSSDDLHPFLAVVSNAQDLTEGWRAEADQEFTAHLGFLPEGAPFLLHAAGQALRPEERVRLERNLRRATERVCHPQPIARLLARAVREVAARNVTVGPNVTCTLITRSTALQPFESIAGGMVPIAAEVQSEAEYFRRPPAPQADDMRWIYSPADPSAALHYGPNFALNGLMMKGFLFGPTDVVDS